MSTVARIFPHAGAIEGNMDALIAAAHAKPSERPKLLQALMSGHLFIIASWKDPKSRSITIQDFYRGEQSFLPVFSDEAHFKAEIAGSGFEDKGVSIDASLFASILKGGELLILNPGSISPIEISASELKKLVDPARLPK